jgi:hypothetical protein
MKMMKLDRSSKWLIAILAVSVILRLGTALYLGNVVDAPPLLTDQQSYDALGQQLITGHGFSFDTGWYPFTEANTPTAHWSFLYSLFVAAVYAIFGPNPLAVRVVQAILGGILLPLLVYRLSRQFFRTAPLAKALETRGTQTETLALVAAGITAVYFYFVLYAATLMTETFYMAALLWTLERTLKLAEGLTIKHSLVLGTGLGLATLLRQSILPWLVMMSIWLIWVGYRSGCTTTMIKRLFAVGGVVVLMILPFTLRNYAVYHEFLLLNSNAGYAMYSAQHPMHGTQFQAFTGAPMPADLYRLNEAQKDRELMRRGIGFVIADPVRYAQLSFSRLIAYFEFWPTADTSFINNLGRVGSFGLLLPLLLLGLWQAWQLAGPRKVGGWQVFSATPLAFLLLFTTFYSALHILTWAMPRYRLPVDITLMPLAALALYDLAKITADKWKARRRLEAVED